MILKLRISGKELGDYKTSNELINAACGCLDANGFNVEYYSATIEKNELLIDSDLEDSDEEEDKD